MGILSAAGEPFPFPGCERSYHRSNTSAHFAQQRLLFRDSFIFLRERWIVHSLSVSHLLSLAFFSLPRTPLSLLFWLGVGGYFQLDFIQFCQRRSTCSRAVVPGVCVARRMSFARTGSFGRGQSVCLRDVSLFISDSFRQLTETNDSTQK